MNEDIQNRVREAYRANGGNLHQVAQELGLPLTDCRQAFPVQPVLTRSFDDEPQPNRDKNGHLEVGRKSLRPKIVAVRLATSWWRPEDRDAIRNARKSYDAGTHILTTGRDGQWIVLYAIKRRKPVAPQSYFFGPYL